MPLPELYPVLTYYVEGYYKISVSIYRSKRIAKLAACQCFVLKILVDLTIQNEVFLI